MPPSLILGLVESADAVSAGLSAARESGREVVWIALKPSAAWALRQAEQAYRDVDEFHDLAALAELDTRNIERTEAFCLWADQRIRARIVSAKERGLEPALSCYYNFRHVFTASALCHALFASMRRAFPGAAEVWYWETAAEAPDADLWLKRESMWSRYLRRALPAAGIAARAFQAVEAPAAVKTRRLAEKMAGAWKVFSSLSSAALSLAHPPHQRLAVMDESYNLAPVLAANRLLSRFAVFNLNRVLQIALSLARGSDNSAVKRSAQALWEEIRADGSLRRQVMFDGLDELPLIEDRLRYFFVEIVPAVERLHRLASGVLGWLRPGAIAATAMGRYWEKTVASAARATGVPFVVYQHGEIGLRTMGPRSHNFWYYNDMHFSGVYLVYGEGQARFCSDKYGSAGARVTCVGSTTLDEITRLRSETVALAARRELGIPVDKPAFVFPLGQFGAGIKVPPTYRTDSASFESHRRIVETFSEFPQVTLVVAPKPVDIARGNPLFELLARRKYPNIVVSTAGFRRLAAAADAFVMDWPSTAFLEALATDRPLLMTDHALNWSWQPGVADHFGKRVLYARELDEFLALIRRFIAAGDYAAAGDRRLIREYGTYRDDGRSAQRVLDALTEIAARGASA